MLGSPLPETESGHEIEKSERKLRLAVRGPSAKLALMHGEGKPLSQLPNNWGNMRSGNTRYGYAICEGRFSLFSQNRVVD